MRNKHSIHHQNGTHRDLFEITEVRFEQFIDNGYHSEAFFNTPTAPKTFWQKLKQPQQFLLPDVIQAHLENYFPSLVILDFTRNLTRSSSPKSRDVTIKNGISQSLTNRRNDEESVRKLYLIK